MKTKLILISAFCFLLSAFALLAQDAAPVAPVDATQQVAGGAEEWIVNFAATHPWVLGVLALVGTLRLVIKPIMSVGRLVTSQTETTKDDQILDTIERSWIYTLFLFGLDWLTSIKLKSSPTVAPKQRIYSFLFCLLLSSFCLGLLGCAGTASPVGQVGAQVGPSGTNIIGGIAWDISTNVNVAANGQVDPTTGQWAAGVMITFRSEPDAEQMALLAKAGVVRSRTPSLFQYLLYKFDRRNLAQMDAIAAALQRGAVITGL